MPTYDYVCKECGHKFERFQKMSDGVLRKCPKCGKLKLKRLLGAGAGIIFKGSGFYETDYKRKSKSDTAGTERPKPEKKTENKAENKAEKSPAKTESTKAAAD
jgi:putative FmdB family regulatory protein